MNLGIDHGYYAIKTKNFSFPAGVTAYSHEPYTLQDTLEADGKFFVCGTGRQPILRRNFAKITPPAARAALIWESGTFGARFAAALSRRKTTATTY